MKAPPCFSDQETASLIKKVCAEHCVDKQLLKDLCDIAVEYSGSGKAFGVDADIADALTRFIESPERNPDVSR